MGDVPVNVKEDNAMFNRLGKYVTEPQLRRWADKRIKQGIPRQQVCAEVAAKFDHTRPSGRDIAQLQKITRHNGACLDVERAIMQVMIDRNEEARQLERDGVIEQAIVLYEESVHDQFLGTFPYDRLRIIYTRQKRYVDAIRVCQVYVDNPYLKGAGQTEGRQEFREKIKKLKEKMQ